MKKILLFLSLFLAFQIGTAQETWNACNSTVNIIPAPSYDSTFVLEAPSRAALQKGMANWVPASSGGGALNYYEVDARLHYDSGLEELTIDEILLNTFPGTWSMGAGTGPQTGFEFNCNDCDGTVDFTSDFPLHANDFESTIQQGFDGTPKYYFLSGYYNGGKSTGWVGYYLDGSPMSNDALVTYPYFKIHFRYYY